ncbi:MAG TPA: flagellar hook-length control protein FliK [Ignavibacteria bacterium]|nr:flagellar hook-length control protein FliK [Ignavibacteria bacterium]
MIFNPLFIDTEAKQIHHIGSGNSSNSYLFRDIIKVAKNNQLARSFNSNEILDAILKDVETLSKANYSANTNADEQLYLILSELNIPNSISQLSEMDLTNNVFDESSFVIATSEEVIEVIENALNNLLKEFNVTIEQPVNNNNRTNSIGNSDTTELLSFIRNQLENNQSVTIQIHQESSGNYYSLTISNMKQDIDEIKISNENESIYVISLKKTDEVESSHLPNSIPKEDLKRTNDFIVDSKETNSIGYNQTKTSKSVPVNESTKSPKASHGNALNTTLNSESNKVDKPIHTFAEEKSSTQINTSSNSVQQESPFRVINFSKHFYERGSIPLEGDNSKNNDLQNPSSLLNKTMHEINNPKDIVDNSVQNKVTPAEKLIQNISQRESIIQNSIKYSIEKSNDISSEMGNKSEPLNSESDLPLLSVREKAASKFLLNNSRELENSIDTSEKKEYLTNTKEKTESNPEIQKTTNNHNTKVEDKNVNENKDTKQVDYHKGVEGKKEVIQNNPVVQNRELNSNGNSPIIIHISQKPGNSINHVNNLQLNDFVNQVQKITSNNTVESGIDILNNHNMPIRIIDIEQKTKTNSESSSPSSERLTNKLENLNSAVRITYHKLNVSEQFTNSGQNSSSDSQTSIKSNENNEQKIVHESANFEKANKNITQEVNREIAKSNDESEKTNKQSNKESDIPKSERIEKAGNNASHVITKDIKVEQPQSLQANQVKVRTKELVQPELNSKIVEEISELVISEKKDKAVIYLEPADMGRIKVALEIIENKLTARLEVETNSAKEMLHNQVEYLRDSLSNNGIQLSSLSISLYSSEQKNSKSLREKRKDSSIKDIDTKENFQKEKQAKSLGYNTYEFIA